MLEGEASKLKSEELELTPEALQAFEDLKKKCMTALVLVFVDFQRPFWLETDASGEGLGAVLLQESDDGHYHPVAFASRELKGGEPKFHSSKLEFLALKWAVTEQFWEYLQYQPFTVRTDNNPLTYPYNSQPGCSRSSLDPGIGQIQHEAGVSEGVGQQNRGYLE